MMDIPQVYLEQIAKAVTNLAAEVKLLRGAINDHRYVYWEDWHDKPMCIPSGCEFESDGEEWKPERNPPANWGVCRRRWPRQ